MISLIIHAIMNEEVSCPPKKRPHRGDGWRDGGCVQQTQIFQAGDQNFSGYLNPNRNFFPQPKEVVLFPKPNGVVSCEGRKFIFERLYLCDERK